MKNKVITILLAAAMTFTGFAMPMTAYGAEEATDTTAQTEEAVQEEAEAPAAAEATVEEVTEEVAPKVTEEAVTEETTEEAAAEEAEAAEETEKATEKEPAKEQPVVIVAKTSTNKTEEQEPADTEQTAEQNESSTEETAAPALTSAKKSNTSAASTKKAAKKTVKKTVKLAPTNLKAVSASYNSIKLTWDSVSGVSKYKVYVSKDNKTWKKYKTVTKTTCTVKHLATKRTRYFKVVSVISSDLKAANAGRTIKKKSDVVSAKALLKKPVLKGKLASDKLSAKLSWKKVAGAEGYKVYKYDASSKSYKVVKTIKSGSTLKCKVTPTPGEKNYYRIRAYRMSEGKRVLSDYSKRVKFNLVGEDATSLRFKASTASLSSAKRTSSTSGTLSWKKVTGASGYSIYKYDSKKGKYVWHKDVKGASTLKTSVKLTSGKATSFKVRAYKNYKGRRLRNGYSSSKKVAKADKGGSIVNTGKTKLGCPYVYGACGPYSFDCSGFVMWVMKKHGYNLPHNAAGQYYALSSRNIGSNWHNAQAGDIVFYSYGGPGSSHHVGIYVGNGKVMHASSSHGCVVITRVTYTNGHIAAICRP